MKKIIFLLIISLLLTLTNCSRESLVVDIDSQTTSSTSSSITLSYINVRETYPANGATNFAVNSPIRVFFDDNIDFTSITNTTFYVNNATVTGSYAYDIPTKSVIFYPDNNLNFNTNYQLTLSTAITNLVGDNLQNEYNFNFTTIANVEPEIEVYNNSYYLLNGQNVNIGSEITGTIKTATFYIVNSGTSDLNVNNITLAGPDIDQFTVSNPIVSPIIPTGSNSFTLDFLATSGGPKNIQVIIDNNDSSESPFVINVTATGLVTPEPQISVRQNSNIIPHYGWYGMGTILIGSSSEVISFTIENIGGSNLDISAIYITGNTDQYMLDIGPTISPLVPGNNTYFNLTFSPTSTGIKAIDIYIETNDPDETPYILVISGKGSNH
jgi:hypothetical protein